MIGPRVSSRPHLQTTGLSVCFARVSTIDDELDDLGRAVQEVLEDYLERNDEASDSG